MRTHARVEDALSVMRVLRLEDGTRWGDRAVPVQIEDATAVCDPYNGPPYHWLGRSRGFSKTSDLAGLALALLATQAPPESRSYGFAADRDQAGLLVDSCAQFVSRSPALGEWFEVQQWRVTNRRSGATLEARAADAPGTWGLRPWLTIIDELPMWPVTAGARGLFEAITTAAAKVKGSRMVLLGTAGNPAHWSRKALDHAIADPLWRVHEVAGPPPWIDPERLAEQKRRLLESSYRRLFANEWVSAEDRLVSDDDLAACVVLDGPLPKQPGRAYLITVDVGLKRDRTVCTVCHGEPVTKVIDSLGTEVLTATRVVLDRIEVWQGTRERPVVLQQVEEWIEGTARTYNNAHVRLDPWQAVGMMQRLRRRGLAAEEFTFSSQSVGRIAAALHRALKDRLLALPDDEELLDELRNVRLEERAPGVVRLAHDPDRHDDRAVALAMAVHRLVEEPIGPSGEAHFVVDDTPYWSLPADDLERLRETVTGSEKLSFGMRL
jgi:hypothetical protein